MSMNRKLLITAFVLLSFVSEQALAQCAGGFASGTNFSPITSTFQTISFAHGFHKTFSATAGTTYRFTFCSNGGSTTLDTQITILDANGLPVPGGYNDDFCSLGSQVTWAATTTGTFRVLVNSFYCQPSNGIDVSLMAYGTITTPPTNDACAGTIAVAIPSETPGSTTLATSDIAPLCITGDNLSGGVWYTVVGNGNSLKASLCGASFDTQMRVFTGTCGGLVCVIGNDDFCGTSSEVTWNSISSTTYRILVYGFSSGVGGFTLNISDNATPTVTTNTVTSIAATTATSGGNVTVQGASAVTARGVVWDINYNPDVFLTTKTINGSGTGTFTSSITGLSPGTTYFLRAYATNSSGTSYGPHQVFTTTGSTEPTSQPTNLVFSSVTQTGLNYAYTGNGSDGYIVLRKIGSYAVSTPVDGTVYTGASTLGDAFVDYVGTATSLISGTVSPGTSYYYSIYAYNGSGSSINYRTISPLQNFVTTSVGQATVTTDPVTAITSTTATCGGNVTSDGGATVTARGVVWSTSTLPTVALLTKTSNGTGTGAFTSSITGLTNNTTYFVRAYATNSSGTAYGTQQTFLATNPASLATVTTNTVTSVASTTATSGGNVTADGGATVTARGVVWSTSTSPTVALTTKTTDGTGPGTFTSAITGLTNNTAYFVRAYATNSAGTAYGTQQTFTTVGVPTVTTTAVTNNTTGISASSGGNVTADNGSSVTARGVVWSTTTSPTVSLTTKTTDGTGTGVFTSSITGLTSNTTYYVRAYATSSVGTGYGSQLTFLTPADPNPPVVIDPTPNKIAKGSPVNFSITVTDASPISSVYIDYGPVEKVEDIYDFFNDGDYDDPDVDFIELNNTTGSTYTGTVPASAIGELGLIYIISAYDAFSNEFVSPQSKIIAVEVTGNGLTIPYTTPGSYKIISVPLNLDKKSAKDVFGDDVEFGNPEKVRIFRYQGGKNVELTATSTIDAGKGYWFISKDAVSLDSGPGVTAVTLAGPVTLALTAGWNQVGSPYPFNLLWADVKSANSSLNLGNLRSFNGNFADAPTLRVYEGGFVFSQAIGPLSYPIARNPAAGRVIETVRNTNPLDADNWEVLLSIKSGELMNELGGFGMHPQANSLNDAFDDFTLPRFFDYLEMNHHKKFLDVAISKDIVPSQNEHIWEFDVATNASSEMVSITWDNSYFGTEAELVLWDVARQRAIDMTQVNSYQFSKNESSAFKVYYGSETFIRESVSADHVVFHEVFPNPANDRATFAFSIPINQSKQLINLEIMDGMGKKVAVVANKEFESGYHEVTWNIKEQSETPSGIYFAQLRDGKSIQTIKLIIQN